MTGASPELRPPPPPPIQKSLSRRVSFNESTLTGKPRRAASSLGYSDTESQYSGHGGDSSPRGRDCLSRSRSCCVYVSIAAAVVLTIFLFLGGIYLAYLQSNLPEVRLHRLDVNELDVMGERIARSDFEVWLNVTNDSDRLELRYRGLAAALASGGVKLGKVKVKDMQQQPRETTDMRIKFVAENVETEEAAAKDLEADNKMRLLVVDVVVEGRVAFYLGGRRMDGIPFKIDCHSIDQSEIDKGRAPRCNTKLSLLS